MLEYQDTNAYPCFLTTSSFTLAYSITRNRISNSSVQRRRERKRSAGQILQPLLAMSRRISTATEMSGHAGVRSKVAQVRGSTHRRLRRTHDTTQPRGRPPWRTKRTRTGGGKPSTGCSAIASRRTADSTSSSPQKLNCSTLFDKSWDLGLRLCAWNV